MTKTEWWGRTIGVLVREFGYAAVFGDDGNRAGGDDGTRWRLDIGASNFEIGLPSFEFLARVGAVGGLGCAR